MRNVLQSTRCAVCALLRRGRCRSLRSVANVAKRSRGLIGHGFLLGPTIDSSPSQKGEKHEPNMEIKYTRVYLISIFGSCFSPFCEGLESIVGPNRKPCPISPRLRFATFATLRKDLHRPRRRSAQTAQRVDCSTFLMIRMRAKPCDRS